MSALIGGLVAWLVVHRSETPTIGSTSPQLRVEFAPSVTPTLHQCVEELRRLGGYTATGARSPCAAGRARSWFTATITNSSDAGAYPICTATAYDHDVRIAFRGRLALLPSGPYIPPHEAISVTW